jgi:VCBS repeat-containing protein
VAIDHAYGAASNQTLTVAAPGVLANDSDPDSNPLIAILVSHLAHGTLTLNTNGSFSFTPHASYTGPDSFTYMANDGQPQDGLLSSVGIASHGRTLEEKNGHSGQHFHHWLPVYRAHKIIYGSLLAMWALGPA